MKQNDIRKNYIVTEDTLIYELAELFPQVAEFLIEEYQFHCIGCPMSYTETIGEGADVHGLNEDEKKELLSKLNNLIVSNF